MFNVHLVKRSCGNRVKSLSAKIAHMNHTRWNTGDDTNFIGNDIPQEDFYIAGNLPAYVNGKSYFLELLRIPGIDHSHCFCSSPYEYE